MKLPRFAAAATTLFVSNVAFANTRICVTVQQKSWYKPVAAPRRRRRQRAGAPPPAPMIDPAPTPAPEVRMRRAGRRRPYGAEPAAAGAGSWGAPPPPHRDAAGAAGAARPPTRTRSIRRCTCAACSNTK